MAVARGSSEAANASSTFPTGGQLQSGVMRICPRTAAIRLLQRIRTRLTSPIPILVPVPNHGPVRTQGHTLIRIPVRVQGPVRIQVRIQDHILDRILDRILDQAHGHGRFIIPIGIMAQPIGIIPGTIIRLRGSPSDSWLARH